MLETLTGIGLATSAGLNAYIPLLMIALLDRYTDLIHLPASWQWMTNGWVIAILVVLLAIEVVADKIPVVDHLNDVVQTVVRPTAGGLAFGAASSSSTVTVPDPGQFFSSHQWLPVAAGIVISFVVHTMKALVRPAVNVTTAGLGTPIASAAEDAFSAAMSFAAIAFPLLILIFLGVLIWAFISARRWRRRRRARRTVHDGQTVVDLHDTRDLGR
jgi:hypothetical protein